MKDLAKNLLDMGYFPYPISPKTKRPKIKDFQEKARSGEAVEFFEDGDNVGILLGDGIVALDLDYDVDGVHSKIISEVEMVGPPPAKVGSKGITYLFKSDSESRRIIKNVNGKDVTVAEILGEGIGTVIPPSIHPTGVKYKWIEPIYPVAFLPELPESVIEIFNELSRAKSKEPSEPCDITLEETKVALNNLDPEELEYGNWLAVSMALKVYGDDGYSAWVDWCGSSNRRSKETTLAKWNSFSKEGYTPRTIFFMAKIKPPKRRSERKEGCSVIRLSDVVEEIRYDSKFGKEPGLSCGLPIDGLFKWREAEWTIVFGPSNAGKTTLMCHILTGLIRSSGKPIAVCSLEQRPKRVFEGFISSFGGKNKNSMSEKELLFVEKEVHESVYCLNFGLCPPYPEKIFESVDGLDVCAVVIDPLAALASQGKDILEKTDSITGLCKSFVLSTGTRLITVAHPNKSSMNQKEKGVSGMYGISGSGNLTNLCDNIITVCRQKNETVVELVKIREQYPDKLGKVYMEYDPELASWHELVEDF